MCTIQGHAAPAVLVCAVHPVLGPVPARGLPARAAAGARADPNPLLGLDVRMAVAAAAGACAHVV